MSEEDILRVSFLRASTPFFFSLLVFVRNPLNTQRPNTHSYSFMNCKNNNNNKVLDA